MKKPGEPVRVPTLDELAKDPALAAELPRQLLADLYRSAAHVEAELRSRLLDARPPADAKPDEPLDVKTAARRLGVAPSTLYQKAKRDPAYRALLVNNDTRKILFSAERIAAYIRPAG